MEESLKEEYKQKVYNFLDSNNSLFTEIFGENLIIYLRHMLDKHTDVIMSWSRQFLVDNISKIWPFPEITYDYFQSISFETTSKYLSIYIHNSTIDVSVKQFVSSTAEITPEVFEKFNNFYDFEVLLAQLYTIIQQLC